MLSHLTPQITARQSNKCAAAVYGRTHLSELVQAAVYSAEVNFETRSPHRLSQVMFVVIFITSWTQLMCKSTTLHNDRFLSQIFSLLFTIIKSSISSSLPFDHALNNMNLFYKIAPIFYRNLFNNILPPSSKSFTWPVFFKQLRLHRHHFLLVYLLKIQMIKPEVVSASEIMKIHAYNTDTAGHKNSYSVTQWRHNSIIHRIITSFEV